jgi:two-component system cell cycle response regulator
MSPAGRPTNLTSARRRTAGSGRAPVPFYRAARPDLAARLRAVQRTLRSRVERRDALLDLMRAVSASLDPEKVGEFIVERAATWVPASSWAVVAAEPTGQLVVVANRELGSEFGNTLEQIAQWVMHHGEEFLTANLRSDERIRAEAVGTVIGLPLSCRGRRIGAVIAMDSDPSSRQPRLSPGVLRAIRMLLEPAAVALDNALQLKRAEALSVTDDLTRLYNSRYLNQVLRRETKRASRSGRPLSLLFIDLDGFKSINDTHGHLFGSRALVEAATVIRGSARETDVVARFGGDEFALILPDTGGEGAYAVGERIRERIADHIFLTGEGLTIRLTASVGVATLPDAAASADELVHAADAAMYQVKARGKNGIQAAAEPADK